MILGSGLAAVAPEALEDTVLYSECGEIMAPGVPGHAGDFALATLGARRVIFARGRSHLYEGHGARKITAGIRFLARAGVRRVVLTNAAGSLNPAFAPGTWMMLSDHLNLTGTSPLIGAPQFLDLTEIYMRRWQQQFAAAALKLGMPLHVGVYAGVTGPQYETPAEVRMLRVLGADAVGMSTVLEAIQARALGLEVAGFSCLTNWAAGITGADLSHDEVLAAGAGAAASLAQLLQSTLRT